MLHLLVRKIDGNENGLPGSIDLAYDLLKNQNLTNNTILDIMFQFIKNKFDNKEFDKIPINEMMDNFESWPFKGNKDLGIQFYTLMKGVKILEFIDFYTVKSMDNNAKVSAYSDIFVNISSYFKNIIDKYKPKSVLFLEAEKFLSELPSIIRDYKDREIYLSTGDNRIKELLEIEFKQNVNVKVNYFSIISNGNEPHANPFPKADLTISMNPTFTFNEGEWKYENLDIFWNEIVKKLPKGKIYCFLFLNEIIRGENLTNLQNKLLSDYHLLSVNNIYLKRGYGYIPRTINIFETKNENKSGKYAIEIIKWIPQDGKYKDTSRIKIESEILKNYTRWEYDFLSETVMDESDLSRYEKSDIKKIPLGEIAEIIRGKTISTYKGNGKKVKKIPISAIENNEINIDKLADVEIPESKRELYQSSLVKKNDLIITCRGSNFKMAIFKSSPHDVLIDGNLIIIRPNDEYDSRYIKLFFESDIGESLIKSINRSGPIISITPKSLKSIEIPVMSKEKQNSLIELYENGMKEYKKKIDEANKIVKQLKEEINNRIFD